eukprot:gene1254-1582_t
MVVTKQRCYYEVLGVERTATQTELKSSYRKLALQWHPDKNQHQLEIAEETFKEINHAYTTLSDPNERKWYDDHREAILRGGKGGADDDFDDGGIDLWPYFSNSCFRGYDDQDEMGFYKVYQRVFDIIDKQEEMEEEDVKYHYSPPKFGNSRSSAEEVLKFYNYWRDFVTKRKFASVDMYNLNQAPNRQIKRLMEKENQKERSKARLEYIEQVRHLTQFIYNRDKRIIEHLKKLSEEAEEKQRLAEIKKQEEDERRMEYYRRLREEKEAELEQMRKDGLIPPEDQQQPPEEAEIPESYCVVCDKSFKSERQLQNHENSNKHKQQVQKMKRSILIDGEDDDIGIDDVGDEDTSTTTTTTTTPKSKKSKKKKGKKVIQQQFDDDEEDQEDNIVEEEEEEEEEEQQEYVHGLVKKNKKNKKKKVIKVESSEDEEEEEEEEEELSSSEENLELLNSMLKNSKFTKTTSNNNNNKSKTKNVQKVESDNDDDDDEDEEVELPPPTKSLDKKKQNNKSKNTKKEEEDEEEVSDDDKDQDNDNKKPSSGKKIGKAKEKRLQRQKKSEEKAKQAGGVGEILICNVCKEEFTSRNKMFQHINTKGHAQAVPFADSSSSLKNKKKK